MDEQKIENPLISRLKEILRCENYVFEKMEHKSAIYVLEKDNILSLTEKYAEITALVEYEKRKVKVKMLKELINHLENAERRGRDEKSAEPKSHRKNNTRQTKNVRIRLVNQRTDKRKNSAGK